MPIKAENKAKYPANWASEIRPAIMQRAGFKCEHPGCTCRQYAVGQWLLQPIKRANWIELAPPPPFITRPFTGYRDQRQRAAEIHFDKYGDPVPPVDTPIIVIVLTVAHLNHDEADCRPENLRAWCQRHHLAYDHQHHIGTAHATRMKKRNNLELPL